VIILDTPRLTLAEFNLDDLDRLAEIVSDPEAVRYIGDGEPASRAHARHWLERTLSNYSRSGFGYWRVSLRGRDELIGWCGPCSISVEDTTEIQLGYLLTPEYWGQGIATEAAIGAREHAFVHLGVERLIALIDRRNSGSKRVAAKIGMTYERDVIFSSSSSPLPRQLELYSVSASGEQPAEMFRLAGNGIHNSCESQET
jgi:[ribosomal protein S5]-alanine N-acetyltransferase